MATTYPSTFPCVQLNGFSATVAMGAARSDIPGAQVQRRVFNTMPHVFQLSFVMDVPTWGAWQSWMKVNGYSWFWLNLPSMYSGKVGTRLSPHLVRLTSPITVQNVTQLQVQVSVTAELSPSMIAKYLEAA